MGFLQDVFGGGKSSSIGGIIGSVLGTSGGIGLLSAIPGVGVVTQTAAGIGARIVQQREQRKAISKASRQQAPAAGARGGASARAAFSEPFGPTQRRLTARDPGFDFSTRAFGVRKFGQFSRSGRSLADVVPLAVPGRTDPRFPDAGGTFGVARRVLSRFGQPTERFLRAFPGGAPAVPTKSPRTSPFGGILQDVGERLQKEGLFEFGRGGLGGQMAGDVGRARRLSPMAQRSQARMQFGGLGVAEAVNPQTGCIEPVESIRAQGIQPQKPFFRFDPNTNRFVKVKARRVNVLNPSALRRSHRRIMGFDRFVKQNFKVVEKRVKFKPKRRRKR